MAKLEAESNELLEKITEQIKGGSTDAEQKRKAFEALNDLKKNVAEKYKRLEDRELLLQSKFVK